MAMGMNNKEDFAVGCVLSIKTALGEEFEGQVITFNRPFNILVLQEGSESGPRKNTRMLNANYIKEFNLIRKAEDPLDLKCCYLDLNTLLAREDFAIRQAEMEAERIGVGVTMESALSRTATDRESMEEDAFSDFLIHEISDFFIWEWRDFLFREWTEPGTFLLANYAPAPKGTLKTIVDDNGRVIDFVRHLVPSGTVGVPRMSKLELEARTQYTKEEKEKLHRHKRHKLSYSSTVVEMCTVKPPSMPHPPFDFSKISLLFAEKEMRILMVGLTGAGKTTILNKLNHGDIVTTINPSSGFKVKTLEHKNISFTAWDLEGDDKLRALWRPYYHSIQAIIFVLDSSDRKRVVEARNELYRILYEDELKDAPLLFIANKEDIINSMSTPEVSNKLCIRTIRRECLLQRGSAISGEGLYEGLNWLSNNIANKAKSGEVGGN